MIFTTVGTHRRPAVSGTMTRQAEGAAKRIY